MKSKEEILEYHLGQLRHPPFNGSIVHFLEGGKINGSFYIKLEAALDEYSDERVTALHFAQIKKLTKHAQKLIALQAERHEYRKALAAIFVCDGMPGFDAAEAANKSLAKYPQQ